METRDCHDAVLPFVVTTFPALPVCVGSAADMATSLTNSVVAICVVSVPDAAVGAIGVPVNVGLENVGEVKTCAHVVESCPLAPLASPVILKPPAGRFAVHGDCPSRVTAVESPVAMSSVSVSVREDETSTPLAASVTQLYTRTNVPVPL